MAAQRLFNVRRQFVDGVTAPVIKDLLNDLLADGVLNERERDSVLEERRARADQAECLIDMVRKKGNEASQKLIDHLKTRDSKLHPVLFPSADQEAISSFQGSPHACGQDLNPCYGESLGSPFG
ncbi:caspase-1-A-like [Myripristis murdjan]|nr:caspase-1-A-like [Myripristis murdjan]